MFRASIQVALFFVLVLCAAVPYYYLSYKPSQIERYCELVEHLDKKAPREEQGIAEKLTDIEARRPAYLAVPDALATLDEAKDLQERRAAYMAKEIPKKRSAYDEVILQLGGIPPARSKDYDQAIKSLRIIGKEYL